MTCFADLRPGESAEVLGYAEGCSVYRQQLLAMGLTPGVAFTVLHWAPLGDPAEIRVRGFKLSLRKAEAAVLRLRRRLSE